MSISIPVCVFAGIVFVGSLVCCDAFFVSHYIFRWRIAMNGYYMEIGAASSHRGCIAACSGRYDAVFHDHGGLCGLANFVQSIMTLIAFLPVLLQLSTTSRSCLSSGSYHIPSSWQPSSGRILERLTIAVAGIKLPGLEFRNQRVEAAYRKELVYGEDHEDRAQPVTVRSSSTMSARTISACTSTMSISTCSAPCFGQADGIFASLILIPSIAAGKITLGIWHQIAIAFGQVSHRSSTW